MTPKVAIVIVNYRTPELTLGAVAALEVERTALRGCEVVVVDGGSADGSAERLARELAAPRFAGWTRMLPLPLNGGFGWANNQAMLRLLQAPKPPDYIHLLNPDTAIEPGAVARLAAVLDAHPRCAAVGSQLVEPDGAPSGSCFEWLTVASELDRGAALGALTRLLGRRPFAVAAPAGCCDWVTGASVMLRATALREVGLFDSGFFLYFEELELMHRLAGAGWEIRHEPASRVAHLGGAATGVNGSRPAALRPPRPSYWYESRRRFLTIAHGRSGATLASLAWLAGHLSLLARRLLGSGRGHAVVDRDARRMLRFGFLPRSVQPAITSWDEPPGEPPAWQVRR